MPQQELPRRFGRYLLFDRIGQGGMAEIYLANVETELGGPRRVVVKQILPKLSGNHAFADMLVREAKLAARLGHRNIVQVTDLGREADRLFIAMEYVEGYDLNQLLRQLSKHKVPLPAEFALLIVREVLSALDYAHRASDDRGLPLGIVHRDVSPSNVLISFEGEVSLCDFGIARAFDSASESGVYMGHPRDAEEIKIPRVAGKSAYMAPEHARGDEVDLRSDLFAAGILLWELMAGRRMYRGAEEELLAQAQKGAIPALPDRGLPEQALLRGIVVRALAVDPAQRFQSAAEMSEALETYALSTQLMASQLRFGRFLSEHFAPDIVELRRSREAAAQALSAQGAVFRSDQPPAPAEESPVKTAASAQAPEQGARTGFIALAIVVGAAALGALYAML